MDILAARKRAAERAKLKGQAEEPASPAAVTVGQSEVQTAQAEATQALPIAAETASIIRSEAAVALPATPAVAASEPAPEAAAAAPRPEQAEDQQTAAPVAAAEEQEAPDIAEAETLAFRLGNEDYLVPVGQVKEVLKLREATPVPHAPEYVPGVVSLRGTVLPVIDLAKRLGLSAGSRDDRSRIIVVGLDDEDAGLIVDRVKGVVRFPSDAVQPAPENLEQGAEFLKGIVRKEGKLYILLDLEKAVGV